MKRKPLSRLFVVLALLGLMLLVGRPVAAQNYAFYVPEMRMYVYVQTDASIRVQYSITFENSEHASPIDVVDVGIPHENYDIGTMSASIDGVPLDDIRPSTYIDIGVEVHLNGQAIPPGETGVFEFEYSLPDMVYQDTTDQTYASLQITPTWFDSDVTLGSTDLGIAIYLPEGVQPEELRYQDEPFTNIATQEGQSVALWRWESTKLTGPHEVGISFPKREMSNVVEMTLFQLMNEWLNDNPGTRMLLMVTSVAAFSFFYFRFTGGTGCALYVPLLLGIIALLVIFPLLSIFVLPVWVILILLNETNWRKRRSNYLPPIAEVEGGGIKRGLTAPEAATLLEMPLNKVLTLVIFGLLNKGILRQVSEDPLKVEVADPYRARGVDGLKDAQDRAKYRRKAAQEEGTVLHNYEQPFIDFIEHAPEKAVKEIDFGPPMKFLITQTAEKLKNFDLSDTQDYYRRIIDRAWEQAESIGEIPERESFLDKNLPWIMMKDDYADVFRHGGYHYWPVWIRRSRPTITSADSGRSFSPGKAGGGKSAPGRTSAGDVAGSFAGWAESTMGGMAAALMPGSLQAPQAKGGAVDLSGVDRVTGDIFEALAKASSSSSGSGGGGGGCACACAGCACACACAGGGR